MTDDEPVTDTPSSAMCTFTPAELDIPESLRERLAGWECSRPVWDKTDSNRCVWHAEHAAKPPDDLAATIRNGELVGARAQETNLTKVSFPESSILVCADLTDANLRGADLTDANLRDADLTDADLRDADLTDADLRGADLTDAHLRGADLTDANLWNADLTHANLFEATLTDANLSATDLTDAHLFETTLTDANLSGTDLTDAHLRGADLTDANLRGADLTDANLRRADLTGANLFEATLTGANLFEAILTGADLSNATLTDTDLRRANLSGVVLNREAQCDDLPRLRKAATAADDPATEWDNVARTYHTLKTAFATNGLVGRARDYHFLEQDAREQEAKAAEGGMSRAYLGSKASRYLTGYGVRASRVGLIMVALFACATAVYWNAGVESWFRYSVTTFTTSPPSPPPPGILTQATAMIETFFGTLLIVLLGYVLGNRERF